MRSGQAALLVNWARGGNRRECAALSCRCRLRVLAFSSGHVVISLVRSLLPRWMLRSERFSRRALAWANGKVASGIFRGMPYVSESHGSVFLPKVLGTYELELIPIIDRWNKDSFQRIVVAGAAEGYYAVGLARRFPQANLVAFEPYPEARAALVRLAERNQCAARIQVQGICHCSSLADALAGDASTFLLVDIEGGEALLLDPRMVPALNRITMLVEIHEFAFPGIEALLLDRFASTHAITRIDARERTIDDLPSEFRKTLPASFEGVALQAMNERRPPGMFWLVLEPIPVRTN
jgi:hypothetical protein